MITAISFSFDTRDEPPFCRTLAAFTAALSGFFTSWARPAASVPADASARLVGKLQAQTTHLQVRANTRLQDFGVERLRHEVVCARVVAFEGSSRFRHEPSAR